MRRLMVVPVLLVLCSACSGGSSGGGADDSGALGDHLSVLPASGAQPKCEGTFTPGQSVNITDPRFSPSGSVTLTITPPGGTPVTSTLYADLKGTIKTTIQLPQVVGSTYITATGVSADGTQTNDTVGVDVLAPGSKCE